MFRFTSRITNADQWRVDGDGFLRVTMCVLRSGVFEYAKEDLPEELVSLRPDLKVWRVRIPESSFSEGFMKSAEGKPVIAWNHEWQETDKIDKDQIVGAMAGEAKVEAGAMVIDGVINDAGIIAAIKAKELVDISAGYHSSIEPVDGDPEADAVQTAMTMNHVVLLPEGRGRCGPTVRILNAKETTMIKVRVKNEAGEEKEYTFTSENDAAEASKMAKEQATPAPAPAAPTAAAAAPAEVQNHDLASAQAEFAKISETLKALEAEKILLEQQIKQFESEEFQEAQMQERATYNADESALMENCSEAEKPAVAEGLKNAKTMNARRLVITEAMCASRGIPFEAQNAKLLFGVLVKTLNKKPATEVRKPTVSAKTNNEGDSGHPIFARKG